MRCKAGECTEAFCQYGCLREHETAIRNLVYHITNNPNDVDDITQEVLMKAYQSLASFRGGSFRAYLARIARNHCYDMLRRKRIRKETALDDALAEQIATTEQGPEDVMLTHEQQREVHQLLMGLGDVDREIMVMRHINEFSYEEIAEALGMRAGTVRTRISRARQKVMELVERGQSGETPVIGTGLGVPRR